MGDLFVLAISSIFINNILLAQYLGNCPFFGTSKKMETAIGMGMAVIFVLVMSGVTTWIINTFFLVRYDLEYLQTLAFILVIASLVQFVEMFLKKSIPALYSGLGIFLPLITTIVPAVAGRVRRRWVSGPRSGRGGSVTTPPRHDLPRTAALPRS